MGKNLMLQKMDEKFSRTVESRKKVDVSTAKILISIKLCPHEASILLFPANSVITIYSNY